MSQMPDMFDANAELDSSVWLKAAQATVRAYCGWHVCPSLTHTISVDSYGGNTLQLPTMHVSDITSIKWGGVEHAADVAWSEAGVLRSHGVMFPDDPRAVTVTLTDGFDPSEVPQFETLLLTVARRAQIQPGIASQSVNGASVSYATASSPGVSLFDSEKALLEPYRIGGHV